ncbi:MAG: AAA family ATPase [Phycisphaerales bacterium]
MAATHATESQPFLLGHSAARRALATALRGGHLHHAWILHGPVGVGKMRAAQALARIVLDPTATAANMDALEPPTGTPVAALIQAGTHPDYHVICKELAAVSESRELRERKQLNIPLDLLRERMLGGVDGEGRHHESAVFRTAAMGHGKVFVVDEAELLDPDAQNAMLKTLEEPPANTTMVLVTSREDRLLPTVRSRCQRVAFGPLDAAAMAAWWERSGVEVPADERAFVDAFAEGAPGMVQRAVQFGLAGWHKELSPLLDQLESGAYPPMLADRLGELVEGVAKTVVDQDEHASKDAANRLGTRLLARMLGLRVRAALKAAADDAHALARALAAQDVLADFEFQVRSNVNLKHALSNLVAQWGARTAARGEHAGRGR